MRAAVVLGICLLLVGPAYAGQREFRSAKKAYDEARETLEEGREKKPEKRAVLRADLEKQAETMVKEDPRAAVEHLLDVGVVSEDRKIAQNAYTWLAKTRDSRAKRELVKAMAKAKGTNKIHLVRALTDVPGKDVTSALSKVLKEKDTDLKVAAVRALAQRGAEAKDVASGSLKRLLKDSSLTVRASAADALEALTGERPKGYPAPNLDAETGFPDRFYSDRIAFLIDATEVMAEDAYNDPFAPPPADDEEAEGEEGEKKKKPRKRKKNKKDKEQKKDEPPPALSPYQVAGDMLRKAMEAMSSDTRFHLARFGRDVRTYKAGYGPVPRSLEDLDPWLSAKLSRERSRDITKALQTLLERDTAPQEIYLFVAGPPMTRGRPQIEETLEAVEALLWGRNIKLHVIAFSCPPAEEPKTRVAKVARDEAEKAYGDFVNKLAHMGGGAATRVPMVRQVLDDDDDGGKAKDDDKAFPVDLTKPIARKDVRLVKDALAEAFEEGDADALVFVEDVAACPDPSKVGLELLGALKGKHSHDMGYAVARGVARNPNAKIRGLVFDALEKERDPARQLLMLGAVGPADGPEATKGLFALLPDFKGDVARMAWSYMADRPAAQLREYKGKLARPAKGLEGLTAFHAAKAMARAAGRPAPATQGLTIASGRFLPDRYLGTGTAFIVDTHRDGEAVFWKPPEPVGKAKQPKDTKKKRGKRGKKDDKKAKSEQPDPVTTLQAAQREVVRALSAVSKAELKANVLTTAGRNWQGRSAELGKPDKLQDATDYTDGLRTTGGRDVWTPLRKALEDPAVEEIYLLVTGVPVRSTGARNPQDLLDEVRNLNRARELPIQVIYLLPPVPSGDARASAARDDLLDAMNKVYEPLAGQNNGRVLTRAALEGLGKKAP